LSAEGLAALAPLTRTARLSAQRKTPGAYQSSNLVDLLAAQSLSILA